MVLLIAAAFKSQALATVPVVGQGLFDGRPISIGVIELELFLGTWLLIARYPLWSWRITLATFLLLLGVGSYKLLSRAESCGCFGTLHVKPAYTASFDLIAVLGLLICPPALGAQREKTPLTAGGWATLIAVMLGGVAFGAWKIASFSGGKSTGQGLVVVDGVTILEPAKWVGHPFTLSDSVDTGQYLASGTWLVVLYRHDCEHCQRAIPRYAALARRSPAGPATSGVMLVEMPPYADAGQQLVGVDSPAVQGKLSDKWEWFAQTPVAIRLIDGQVVAAAEGEQAEDPASVSGPITAP